MNTVMSNLFVWMSLVRLILYAFLIYSLLSLAFAKPKNGKHDYMRYIHVINAAIFAVLGVSLVSVDFYNNRELVGFLREYVLTPLLITMTALIWYNMMADSKKEVELEEKKFSRFKDSLIGDETHGHSAPES